MAEVSDPSDDRPVAHRPIYRDVGNFYRHRLDNVAASYVWETVTVHLPPVPAAVVAEI